MPTPRLIKPYYTIFLKVGEHDLSMRVKSLFILSNINMVFPLIYVSIEFSAKDYANYKVYGQEDVLIKLVKTDETGNAKETLELNLLITDLKIPFSTKLDNGGDSSQQDQSETNIDMLHLTMVPKESFKMLSTPTNFVLETIKNQDSKSDTTKIERSKQNNPISDKIAETSKNMFSDVKNNLLSSISNISTIQNLASDQYLKSRVNDLYTNVLSMENGVSDINIDQINSTVNSLVADYGSDVFGSLQNSMSSLVSNISGNSTNFLPLKTELKNDKNSTNPAENTPLWMVKQMYDKYYKDQTVKLRINVKNQTTKQFQRCVIPPNSFIKSIKYLDDNYGIFKGSIFKFCNLKNEFCIWDISSAIDDEVLYNVEFLNLSEEIKETGENTIQTYSELNIKNNSNTSTMKTNYENVLITKPINKFYNTLKLNVNDMVDNFAGDGEKTPIINEVLKTKKSVISKNITGFIDKASNSFFTSKFSNAASKSNKFSFNLSMADNIPFDRFLCVGSPIMLKPHLTDYINYQGKYIVSSILFTLSKQSSPFYYSSAKIDCFRFNTEY